MSLKILSMVVTWLFVNLQRVHPAEVTVTCNILTTNYCYIENELELKDGDSLKFVVDNPDSITTLDIIQNSKLDSLPYGIFKTFPAIEKLFVDGNQITRLQADRFEDAKNLKRLSMYKNDISVIPSRVFSSLTNVLEILLMDNKIDTIEDNAFDGMVALRELTLDNNRIRIIGRLAFTGAANIRVLNLNSNRIETIEEGALSLPNLETLYLYRNELKLLSDTLLIGAPNLVFLSLSKNPIEHVSLTALAALEKLKMLYLDDTKLSFSSDTLPDAATVSKLEIISLDGIGLSEPDILKHLSVFGQLEELSATNNKFTEFYDIEIIRDYFPKMKKIELGYNKPSLCIWIKDNEEWLNGISVWSTTDTTGGTGVKVCRSADFSFDEIQPRN